MTITLRAFLARGGNPIDWTFDNPQQAMRPWKQMTNEGITCDTGERIIHAYYFGAKCGPKDPPTKSWHAELPATGSSRG